ncbi:MAG: 50S ribosomal protein L19 [Chlamydiota bacterium]
MSTEKLLSQLRTEQIRETIDFSIGDTIRVHLRVREIVQDVAGKGSKNNKTAAKAQEKERIQMFMGTVIARKGAGISETFSLYRIAYGESMERVFPLHSPKITKIELVKRGKVRRSKLYYLRGTTGKKAKIQELLGPRKETKAAVTTAAPEVHVEG